MTTDHDAQLGFDATPERYRGGGREVIDQIRDSLGEQGFRAYCFGQFIRYTLRAGKKGPEEVDLSKADFYIRMGRHLRGLGPDPRETYRDGFIPYERPADMPGAYREPRLWLEICGGILLGEAAGLIVLGNVAAVAWLVGSM